MPRQIRGAHVERFELFREMFPRDPSPRDGSGERRDQLAPSCRANRTV